MQSDSLAGSLRDEPQFTPTLRDDVPAFIIPTLDHHPAEKLVVAPAIAVNELPSRCPKLGGDDLHLWHVELDLHAADSLRHLLSPDELTRADRFHFEKDQRHFTVARGLLRTLLATYLQIAPEKLRLAYGEKGKPFLEVSPKPISFNLAHSGGRAIYAFSANRELGVDLELIREDMTGEQIAKRFFSSYEIEVLNAVPATLRNEAFFNCWTRKEAYIKARGEGLSMPLDEFDVSLTPGEPAALLRNHVDDDEISRWELLALPVAPGYVGALVVEGTGWNLKTLNLIHSA